MRKEYGKFVTLLDEGIMERLELRVPRAVYRYPKFMHHIKKHSGDFKKHGSQLRKIVEEPHWYGNTNGVEGQFLFIRIIGSDYVCVAIHDTGDHLSIRSFYIKRDHQTVKRWIASNTIRPFNRNQAPV